MNFLLMGAVSAGLRWLEELGVERIGMHAALLSRSLTSMLGSLRHRGGQPMVQLYGPADQRFRGAVVTFNVLDEQGRAVPHETFETVAREVRVSVRGGCFCNPGAAEQVGSASPRRRRARCARRSESPTRCATSSGSSTSCRPWRQGESQTAGFA